MSINCECGGKYTKSHKNQHIKTIGHQQFVKTGIQALQKIKCIECGENYYKKSEEGHFKSWSHITKGQHTEELCIKWCEANGYKYYNKFGDTDIGKVFTIHQMIFMLRISGQSKQNDI